MVALREGRWVRYVVTAIVALGLSAFACASQPDTAATAVEPAIGNALTNVRVETGESGTTVTLEGLVDPIYTAFLHAEPRALVLDLAAVEIATTNDLVMVYDGLVDHVTVSSYGGSSGEALARVEIALSQEASYEIVSTPDGRRGGRFGSGRLIGARDNAAAGDAPTAGHGTGPGRDDLGRDDLGRADSGRADTRSEAP